MRYAVFVAFLATSLNMLGAPEDISIKAIQRMTKSIVPIVCGYMDEHKEFQLVGIAGTGFFVDRFGRFITASHVLDSWNQLSEKRHACFPAVYIPDQGWEKFQKHIRMQYFPFTTCERDAGLDLVVCQPVENPFTSKRTSPGQIEPVAFDTTELPTGTTVAFSGFPLESTAPITSKGIIAGTIGIENSDAYFDWIVDKSAWPGASGSPIYLPNGKVIGIILSTGTKLSSGLTFGRNASAVVDFLAKYPYIPQQKNEKQQH